MDKKKKIVISSAAAVIVAAAAVGFVGYDHVRNVDAKAVEAVANYEKQFDAALPANDSHEALVASLEKLMAEEQSIDVASTKTFTGAFADGKDVKKQYEEKIAEIKAKIFAGYEAKLTADTVDPNAVDKAKLTELVADLTALKQTVDADKKLSVASEEKVNELVGKIDVLAGSYNTKIAEIDKWEAEQAAAKAAAAKASNAPRNSGGSSSYSGGSGYSGGSDSGYSGGGNTIPDDWGYPGKWLGSVPPTPHQLEIIKRVEEFRKNYRESKNEL